MAKVTWTLGDVLIARLALEVPVDGAESRIAEASDLGPLVALLERLWELDAGDAESLDLVRREDPELDRLDAAQRRARVRKRVERHGELYGASGLSCSGVLAVALLCAMLAASLPRVVPGLPAATEQLLASENACTHAQSAPCSLKYLPLPCTFLPACCVAGALSRSSFQFLRQRQRPRGSGQASSPLYWIKTQIDPRRLMFLLPQLLPFSVHRR